MIETIQTLDREDAADLVAMLVEAARVAGFSESERACITDITCGSVAFDPLHVRHLNWQIQDADDWYFERWKVGREDLVRKVASLDPLSRLAVLVRCRSQFVEA